MGKEQKDSGRAMGIVAFFTLFMAIMTFNLIVFPACALSTMEVLGVGQAELTTLTSVTSVVGVFGGIIVGLGVAALHNRFHKIVLPNALSFFGGSRFVPISW